MYLTVAAARLSIRVLKNSSFTKGFSEIGKTLH